jgi:hypothetical protein
MSLSERHLGQALFCAAEVHRARRDGKQPGVKPWNAELIRALELELAVSRSRRDEIGDLSPTEHEEWIGTRDAATRLGWTARQVQRRAADLAGYRTSAGWIFPAAAVEECAEAMTDGRTVA